MKKLLLYLLFVLSMASIISCRETAVLDTAVSDAVEEYSQIPSLEEKIGRLNNYDIPILETPSDDFMPAEEALRISKALLLSFFTDEIKSVTDYDFDVNALADAMPLPSLFGYRDAALWKCVTLLPDSSEHLEVGIYIEAVTGNLLKIEFQGKMFNPKKISEEDQALFLNRFDELTPFATIQDLSSSERTSFLRNTCYSTDTSISVLLYIDNGYFTISCI